MRSSTISQPVPSAPGRAPVARRIMAFLAGVSVLLGIVVAVAAPPAAANPAGTPFGFVDQVTSTSSGVVVAGWTIDPDTAAPIDVHIYRGTTFLGSYRANQSRPDVGAVFPASGANHGYAQVFPTPEGSHRFCAYAINVGAGLPYTELGCRTVTVSSDPFGRLDMLQRVPGTSDVSAAGWALDPNSSEPIKVHVYVNGVFGGEVAADGYRGDVASLHWWSGGRSAFEFRFPAGEGTHQVCAYAIGVGPGAPWRGIGCASITVNAAPFGYLESARVGNDMVRVTGWAIDPDTAAAIDIHYYIDGYFAAAVPADVYRNDVAGAYPLHGGNHGFSVDLWLWPGARHVCAYAINAGPGPGYVGLGCLGLGLMPPAASGSGRRIVYANLSQRVWLIGDDGLVDHTYPVSGKYLDPPAGNYRVYGFYRWADAGHDGITMEYFVAFHPGGLGYGFHTIPVDADGNPLQSESELGFFRSAGCVRQKRSDAVHLWNWARLGDPVVLLAR